MKKRQCFESTIKHEGFQNYKSRLVLLLEFAIPKSHVLVFETTGKYTVSGGV